jgi:arylsulfatase
MPSNEKPNILWYCTDQQRFDTIKSLGNPHINTPNLDALIEEGVAFKRTYCQSPICTPSRASFMTGRYPASHHVHRNGNPYFPPSESLISGMLEKSGYDCGLIGKQHLSRANIVEQRPEDDGYRFYKWSHHPYPDWPEGHAYADWVNAQGVDHEALYKKLGRDEGPPVELHQTKWCSDMAIEFIGEERDGPWMLNINVFDPHTPFDPPPEYMAKYDPEKMPYPLFQESDVERQKDFVNIDQQTKIAINPYDPVPKVEAATGDARFLAPRWFDARKIKAAYYAMIELIDDQFKRIIDTLKENGDYDNTIIIFTSDHGEMLGDHGLLQKGCRFFEGLSHVPLIMSWPAQGIKNCHSEALVELIDIVPTLLEAAEIDIPENIQGKSLLPIIRGEADPHKNKDLVLCEYNDALAGKGIDDHTHGLMVFDGRYKICLYEGHEIGELYDLNEDPGEYDNLWNKEEFASLKAEMTLKATQKFLNSSDAGLARVARF